MPIRYLYPFVFFLLLQGSVQAEEKPIQAISVGDSLPELVFTRLYNAASHTVRLSDYRDQLLLLDFWATNCGSCIKLFPKYDSLERVMGGRLKVFPVTSQPMTLIERFWPRNPYLSKSKLPTIVEDSVLCRLFPHTTLPHLVWVYGGIVRAITPPDYATPERFAQVLTGVTPSWPVKKDAGPDFDYTVPLAEMARINRIDPEPDALETTFSRYLEGVFYHRALTLDTLDGRYRLIMVNYSIPMLYNALLGALAGRKSPPVRLFSADPARSAAKHYKGSSDGWKREHLYCFEARWPARLPYDSVLPALTAQLDAYLQLRSEIRPDSVLLYEPRFAPY